jgi:hypothetical protein
VQRDVNSGYHQDRMREYQELGIPAIQIPLGPRR